MLSDLIEPQLVTGLWLGAIAALVMTVAPLLVRRSRLPTDPSGLVVAAAGSYALHEAVGSNGSVTVGVVVLALGGWLADTQKLGFVKLAAVFLPGALVLVTSLDHGTAHANWAKPVFFVLVVVAPLIVVTDRRVPSGLVFLLVSAVGIYLAVPDTEAAQALIGLLLPVSACVVLTSAGRTSAAVIYPTVGLLGWAAFWAGAPQDAAIVGCLATLTVPALIPVAWRSPQRVHGVRAGLPMALHVPCVLVAARIAALRTQAADAVIISAGLVAIVGLVLAVAGRRVPDSDRQVT